MVSGDIVFNGQQYEFDPLALRRRPGDESHTSIQRAIGDMEHMMFAGVWAHPSILLTQEGDFVVGESAYEYHGLTGKAAFRDGDTYQVGILSREMASHCEGVRAWLRPEKAQRTVLTPELRRVFVIGIRGMVLQSEKLGAHVELQAPIKLSPAEPKIVGELAEQLQEFRLVA